MRCKKIEESIFKGLMILSTAIVLSSLFLILAAVCIKALPAINMDMITKTPQGGFYLGKEGGVLNATIGSLLLTGGATLISLCLSVPIDLCLNLYLKNSARLAHVTRTSLDVLWGIPSIVYGAFGFTLMLFFGVKTSLLGGMITVALLILPIMSRAMDEVIRMVPKELLEASYSLGATKLETAIKVVVRQALPGILSAILIAFGRGIGDAASVIFTAGFSDRIPTSLLEPVATLPLAIFFQLGTPFPEVQERAYASAFILTALILFISLASRILMHHYNRHVVK
jgi:phosphate transport system permease protein